MSSVLTEGILTIAIVLAASAVAAVFIQSSYQLNRAQVDFFNIASDSASTSIKIVLASNSSIKEITAWIKNSGKKSFNQGQISQFDVFFGPENAPKYIPKSGYNSGWNYSIASDFDGDRAWDPGETLEIKIYTDYEISVGDYIIKVVTNNGVADTYKFSL